LRKLKFQYLEEHSKDKYVKIIVNDDPPEITVEDVEKLQAANVPKKDSLKTEKMNLIDRWSDVKRLAPLVEQGTRHGFAMYLELAINLWIRLSQSEEL